MEDLVYRHLGQLRVGVAQIYLSALRTEARWCIR